MNWLEIIQGAFPIVSFGGVLTIAAGTAIGKLGASGRLQFGLTLLVGFLIGFAGSLAWFGIPADFAMWFVTVVLGLLSGFTGVGVYEAGVHAAKKGSE